VEQYYCVLTALQQETAREYKRQAASLEYGRVSLYGHRAKLSRDYPGHLLGRQTLWRLSVFCAAYVAIKLAHGMSESPKFEDAMNKWIGLKFKDAMNKLIGLNGHLRKTELELKKIEG